jgi:choline dehydrogenase-like flavoprotein
MIVDLNTVDSDPFIDKIFDICICGAGVAGITLATRLPSRLNVLLLEGGGLQYSDASQDIYKGETVGEEYWPLERARLRYFGGTSNHWDGWCRPLDSFDFKSKPYIERSGWPIERRDLDPYLKEAESILDITETSGEVRYPLQKDFGAVIVASADFQRTGYKWSAPTRFGAKYLGAIKRKSGLACYVNANVVGMKVLENRPRLEHVEVRDFSGKSFIARARIFVLAAGGIENPRILLNCNQQMTNGLGNDNGLVGRFFADHPLKTVGAFILEDQARQDLTKNWNENSRKNGRYFSPSRQFMEREQILNFSIAIEPLRSPNDGNSFKKLLRDVICDSEWSRAVIEKFEENLNSCAPFTDGKVQLVSEQSPNASSRVSLGADVDQFGLRRVVLDWRLSELDRRTMQRAVVRFSEVFAKLGIGRVNIAEWLLTDKIEVPGTPNSIAGMHHMCTTRMGKTSRDGVVDSHQRLFGVENLYLGGSSVFSTSGQNSPTITIVQMTLRLGDHLNEVLKAKAG